MRSWARPIPILAAPAVCLQGFSQSSPPATSRSGSSLRAPTELLRVLSRVQETAGPELRRWTFFVKRSRLMRAHARWVPLRLFEPHKPIKTAYL